MGVIHRLESEATFWRLFAQEYIISINPCFSYFTRFGRSVTIGVESPRVENDQPADVLWIDQPIELLFLAAPRFTRFRE